MKRCNVCGSPLDEPIYQSESNVSITSLCTLREGCKKVWLCPICTHLSSEALEDTNQYYETDYRILLNEEDEDQIYEVRDGKTIYRTEHQIKTLLQKVPLPQNSKLLDFGCAKASTAKRLLSTRKDLYISLFDVSSMYTNYWDQFIKSDQYALYQTPDHWRANFDLITSFFALEHIPSPLSTVRNIADLLDQNGTFYGIVPDTFGNRADFVVIDHVNHFTKVSLYRLLMDAGFQEINIDSRAHRGALIFTARKKGPRTPAPCIGSIPKDAHELAVYWKNIGATIRSIEGSFMDKTGAIYGSGFYGSYILSTLATRSRITCFIDANPYQQGKTVFGKPVISPENMPSEINLVYVGLNPSIAHEVMNQLGWEDNHQLTLIYMDDELE